MRKKVINTGASVKVMLSYDYCHFEIALSSNDGEQITNRQVNEMRKDAQRLADEAIRQYKIAKECAIKRESHEKRMHDFEINRIQNKLASGGQLTIEEQATVKLNSDIEFQRQYKEYNYIDDDEPDW